MNKFINRPIHLKLQTKIMLLMIFVVFVSISITVSYISNWRSNEIREEIEANIMNMATIVANSPVVIENLGKYDVQYRIQGFVDKILQSSQDIGIIVVVDMNNIRYAHPNKERIGKEFVGGDEKRVLEKGESYISVAVGTLGRQIRAFVPVYNHNGDQIGFVMVSKTMTSYREEINRSLKIMIVSTFIGLLIGAIGAFFLSSNIKKTLLGLEPDEITRLYIQRDGMLDALHEGIIAIDEKNHITLVNNSAIKMLSLNADRIIGRDIQEVFSSCKLGDVIISGKAEYYSDHTINNTLVVINRVPIKDGSKIIGAIATFSDRTKVKQLAEEITGVRQIVDALRANSHEFMNKLHTVLGLIDLGEIVEAKKYIMNETERHQKILTLVIRNIKDPAIAGLIIGKTSRANELGIKMRMDRESTLDKNIGKIDSSALITILGNLIENAMDALKSNITSPKLIEIFIKEYNDKIIIKVKDNGIGIKTENLEKIFEKGYSTKEGSRGQGLFLVKDIVEALKGRIHVESVIGQGTLFTVELPKEDDTHD
jgi:two-component system CitB family sensor kinase/two-component system sensor histidine kinase DctS